MLSEGSTQGIQEFLTEITMISSMQHDNLVKLYGCCAEGVHRILVYGYLENNSLAQTLLGNSCAAFNLIRALQLSALKFFNFFVQVLTTETFSSAGM